MHQDMRSAPVITGAISSAIKGMFSKHSKVKWCLYSPHHPQAAMKATAEEHHVLHRDAYNLLNLHIRRFLENNDQHPFAAEPPITAQVLWAWAYKYVNYPANHPEEVVCIIIALSYISVNIWELT